MRNWAITEAVSQVFAAAPDARVLPLAMVENSAVSAEQGLSLAGLALAAMLSGSLWWGIVAGLRFVGRVI